ncbi:terpene synthase [Polyplosphaeria fusca]|uniref:Terpene cyclase/mutase family member n=1 Tax=Polyplosphaeria fusca TaxID=682080 RepID=A0A9P4QX48_9PLEO|nr:terpene synthase [Polyplosphaeria fusca]
MNGTNGKAVNGHTQKVMSGDWKEKAAVRDQKTDLSRWRLKNDRGVQTWVYLKSDEEVQKWPQSTADKWFLNQDTGLPDLPPAKTPLDAANNGLQFFSKLQLEAGNWACEYGGPMFLLPGLVIVWYVTNTPIPEDHSIEIKRYLFARQNPEDGGWGLHIEGESSAFGCAMNYTCLRLLGVEADDQRMVKARKKLWELGGALNGPHWAKFWLSVLGVTHWDCVNPCPPELWLLPDWVPVAPWRWWIHMRMVFLAMSYVYSKRWTYPLNDLVRSLRSELIPETYETINFDSRRNTIAPTDNYHPKTWVVRLLFWLLINIWFPFLRTASIKKRAEDHAWWLLCAEDDNTTYANLGPVNGPMNTLCAYIHGGPDGKEFQEHLKTLPEFIWMKGEGMLMNGTNGVQVWDTSFAILAVHDAGLAQDPRWKPMLTKALGFLEDQQVETECRDIAQCYRQSRKWAWTFSNKKQSYTVSDCTSEGLKSCLALQSQPGFPKLVSDERLKGAVDILLTMQNATGGCASYEPQRGSELLEWLNAAEVFGRIMVEYDYPECTTAVVTALRMFQQHFPSYRADEIRAFKARAVDYIRRAQRPDGSWYGSWGICFSYAGFFALESLAGEGETYATSERVRRACEYFLDKQMPDGGWGETYRSCETGVWHQHAQSQVVHTAWVVIALLYAEYPDPEPLKRGLKIIMSRQQSNGEWLQEAIEGVFNKSCMISYPNYKFIFPVKALGLYARRFGNEPLL